MRFGSLFSGIGGFDLGFERAGMECAWQCEIDDNCRGVLKRHWPEVHIYDDVRDIGRGVEPVDLICGGFPCQDLSVAGRRKGLAGERSGLWHEFARVLAEVRPEWCVIENVPGLLSSNKGRDFAVVLHGLVELGYLVCWRVLDAQYFGLAQRRKRVFIVGCTRDGRAAEVLFEREGVSRNPPTRRAAGQDATPILEAGARTGSGGSGRNGAGLGESGDPMFTLQSGHQHAVAKPLGYGSRTDLDNNTYIAEKTGDTFPCVAFNWQSGGDGRQSPTLERTSVLQSNQTPAVAQVQWASGGGRVENDTAQALRACAETNYQFARVASTVRRLTPTECTRLQGFPDDWEEIYDADEAQAHAREVLHGLWREIGTENGEGRRSGITVALLTPEILFAGVHGGWVSWEMAFRGACASREIQGADAWPEGLMRCLWQAKEARPSPYRRESFEQFARELGRSVQELPLEGAQARAYLLHSRLWEEVSQEWPLRQAQPEAETRVSAGLSDAARYRQLGNAVAVPVAAWIGRRIMEETE